MADAGTDGCLGMANYHDRHSRDRRVTIGYMCDPAHQQRGLATEALSALLDYCFGELGVHRSQAFIDPGNTGSRRLVERNTPAPTSPTGKGNFGAQRQHHERVSHRAQVDPSCRI